MKNIFYILFAFLAMMMFLVDGSAAKSSAKSSAKRTGNKVAGNLRNKNNNHRNGNDSQSNAFVNTPLVGKVALVAAAPIYYYFG